MQIYHDMNEWCSVRHTLPSELSLGFVPTMGNLHLGHTSLFQQSVKENDITIASIFVNPTQFNHKDDFTHYPRTLDEDLALLAKAQIDYCILPSEQALYADGYRFQVQENQESQAMEGKHRPGHFNGVLSVVMKLLNLARPNRAYFGEKDCQQFQLIRDMVDAFFMNIEIKPCPTIRAASGLALSSRNNRLTPRELQLADQFAAIFHSNQSHEQMIHALTVLGIHVEYIEEQVNRRFAAVRIGEIRLIDNLPLKI